MAAVFLSSRATVGNHVTAADEPKPLTEKRVVPQQFDWGTTVPTTMMLTVIGRAAIR